MCLSRTSQCTSACFWARRSQCTSKPALLNILLNPPLSIHFWAHPPQHVSHTCLSITNLRKLKSPCYGSGIICFWVMTLKFPLTENLNMNLKSTAHFIFEQMDSHDEWFAPWFAELNISLPKIKLVFRKLLWGRSIFFICRQKLGFATGFIIFGSKSLAHRCGLCGAKGAIRLGYEVIWFPWRILNLHI